MYSTSQRMITEEEKAALQGTCPPPPSAWKEFRKWYGRYLLILLLVWPVAIYQTSFAWATSCLLAVAVVVLNPWNLREFRSRLEFLRKQHEAESKKFESLPISGPVTVEQIKANAVLEIFHDEGQFYVFDIGNGELFATDTFGPDDQWPNDSFEILKTDPALGSLPPICKGNKLEPIRTIEFRELDQSQVPDDLSGCFTGSLEELILREN